MIINKKTIYTAAMAAALFAAGCKKEAFVAINTNPDVLYSVKPEEQFLNAAIQIHGQDFEWFYDNYRRTMYWMQMSTALGGNSGAILKEVGNTNQRLSIFYPGLGTITTDVQSLINKMSDQDKAARQHLYAMADVMKIYYAFYVSDINGSLAYSEAFDARYGGTLTPKWESQQSLYGLWDTRLKEVIATLKGSSTGQIALGNLDQYFAGNSAKWAKAAAALRMRIAMRLLKRDNAKATTILKEVVADAGNLMTSNADGWVFIAHQSFTAGGNWNPEEFRAPKPSVDYMIRTGDPRLNLLYLQNNYTQANMDAAIAAGIYPAGTPAPSIRHVGAPISPDVAQGSAKSWFQGKRVNATLTLDTVSYLQRRMFQPTYGGGDGQAFFPLITYADQLFMRAELAARGITTENAETLYNMGIDASIQFFNTRAAAAKTIDYMAVTQAQIDAYKNNASVKYSAAKALELIAVQQYINFYKQPNEAWALFKRTGMPNKNTALANEDIMIDGTVYAIPRRAQINVPSPSDLNRDNRQAAIDDMMKDPEFGGDPLNVYGRIWWDKQ